MAGGFAGALDPRQCCPRDHNFDGNCDRHPAPRAYFFGCWNRPGHFWHAPGGRDAERAGVELVPARQP